MTGRRQHGRGRKARRGWIGVRLDVPVDWDEVTDLVTDADRVVAPKRLVAELDAGRAARVTA